MGGESSYAVNNMPASVEMVYSDIGDEIYTGGRLSECHGDDNPCRAAMIDQNGWGNGRCSWDGLVTYRAIKGSASAVHAEEAGVGGKARVEWNGANFWDDNQADNQNWLVLNGAWDENWDAVGDARWRLTDEIDSLLCQDPGHGGGPDPTQKPTENPPVGGTISNSMTGLCLLLILTQQLLRTTPTCALIVVTQEGQSDGRSARTARSSTPRVGTAWTKISTTTMK